MLQEKRKRKKREKKEKKAKSDRAKKKKMREIRDVELEVALKKLTVKERKLLGIKEK